MTTECDADLRLAWLQPRPDNVDVVTARGDTLGRLDPVDAESGLIAGCQEC
jgi:hypothetical protein